VELNVRDARGAALVGGLYAVAQPVLPAALHLDCPLRRMTGIPCPLCGMTTAVGATLHLDLVGALRANPFGIAVAVLAMVLLVRPPRRVAVPAWGAVALAIASWSFELHRYGVV
jgi:hypothetical protein